MFDQEEDFAQSIREVAEMMSEAEIAVATTEANLKRVIALTMLRGEHEGNKSAAAQSRFADASTEVYEARVQYGAARGKLAAAKVEFKAREIAFEHWRTKAANLRMERKAYNA